jgi:hypothetical protein
LVHDDHACDRGYVHSHASYRDHGDDPDSYDHS